MKRLLPLALLLCLIVAFRLIGSAFPETLPNFQPLAALFFCGACMLKGRRAWAIPLAAWLVTYPAPALLQGNADHLGLAVLATTGIGFAATFLIGKSFVGRSFGTLVLGSVAAALAFHLITNGAAWIGSPLYPKTAAGLWQSLWAGPLGGAIPNWVFLRNMALANVLFTSVFLSARIVLPQLSAAPSPVAAR
jgi:hypothetical protein